MRLFMGNGTARPADGFSISIDNDLPNLASPAEEGAGNGMKICFDAWDSGGGDLAPQVGVSMAAVQAMQALLVRLMCRRKTDSLMKTATWLHWDNEEWADVKISVIGGLLLEFRGHIMTAGHFIWSV